MKKSRIILPAAALLALSSAAAVTGTVAWFTANRIRSVGVSGVTAVNPEQGLVLANVAAIQHTTVDRTPASPAEITDSTVWTVAHDLLRDASYDASTGDLYRSVLNETGAVTGYAAQAIANADTKKFNNNNVYFATQFSMDFKVTREDNQYKQCLMFDFANSSITGNSGTGEVLNSIRIAIACGSEYIVWAPHTAEETVKHVTGTTLNDDTDETENVVKGGETHNLPDDSTGVISKVNMEGDVLYLGVLSETTALTVTVTTWFEGLDKDCVNGSLHQNTAFTGSLQFSMRKGDNSVGA